MNKSSRRLVEILNPMRTFRISLLVMAGLAVVGQPLAQAAESASKNWPQFRGAQASGLAGDGRTPQRWNIETGENLRWQAAVPWLAHSAPIIWGGRIYLTTAVRPGKADLKVGPPPEHRLARAQVVDEMRAAGYALVAEPALLEHQYVLVFSRQ